MYILFTLVTTIIDMSPEFDKNLRDTKKKSTDC